MSLKPVEMQASFPRSQNAGKLQEQLQQRGQIAQDVLANEQQKEWEKQRKQVVQADAKEKARLGHEQESRQTKQHGAMQERKENEGQPEEDIIHPFKGKYVDFSG